MSSENESADGVAEDAPKARPEPSESREQQAEHLQEEVEAARDSLGDLVGELDRRRHRATKPIVLGAVAVAVAGIGSYLLWRVLRSRPVPKLEQLRKALQRRASRANVAEQQPSVVKRVLAAAAVRMASVGGSRALAVLANERR